MMDEVQKETDSLGEVDVAADKLWGAMGFVMEDELARVVDPVRMVKPDVAIAE